MIAPAVLQVKVDGVSRDIDVSRRPPRLSNVLFMTRDELEYLVRIVPQLGGHETDPPSLEPDQQSERLSEDRPVVESLSFRDAPSTRGASGL